MCYVRTKIIMIPFRYSGAYMPYRDDKHFHRAIPNSLLSVTLNK